MGSAFPEDKVGLVLSFPWFFIILVQWFVRVGMLATMRVESYLNASIRFIDVSNPKDFIHQKDTFPYKVIGLLLRDDLFSVVRSGKRDSMCIVQLSCFICLVG